MALLLAEVCDLCCIGIKIDFSRCLFFVGVYAVGLLPWW